ncbi:MAG: hypothetical protein QNI84_04645 [Henriciella sp.]|nr:hypothetical protein [Henriciella sp.]
MRFINALKSGLIASALVFTAAPANGFGIGLQPTTVEMTVEPGERQRQIVNLGNVHQEQKISLTIGLADWTLDEEGQIELAPPGESEDSASEWVRFSPAFVTLEPGETQQVVVDMSAPMRTTREGDFRFALIASTILPEERSGQSGVWKKYQIASLFYLTMGDAESRPEITAANLSLDEEGAPALDLVFENDGNAHARLRGEVEITGDNGDPIVMPINNLVVLNDGKRDFTMPLSGELPANPTVKIALDNIFAPQNSSGMVALQTYEAPLVLKEAGVDVAPMGTDDGTTLE